MEEKKMQAAESGSLYMTLDAFYRPVYLSMRGHGEEGFSRYISNNVRFHTADKGIYSQSLNVPFRFQGQKSDSSHTRNGQCGLSRTAVSGAGTGKDSSFGCGKTEGCGIL